MTTVWFPPAFSLLLFLGVGSPALGLLRLFQPASGRSVLGTVSAGVLGACAAGFSAAAILAGQPTALWAPAVAFLALCGVVAAPCRSFISAVAARGMGLLRAPAVQVAGLLVGCPALALWGLLDVPALSPLPGFDEPLRAADPVCTLVDIKPSPVRTDKGQEIRAARRTPAPPPSSERAARQTKMLTALGMHTQVIALPATSEDSNCHGWVFTRGRHWLPGEEVETILRHNDYRLVAKPQPGDLALYRGPDGLITHTGVVRTTVSGAVVLVESKWGEMGAYVHPADVHPYEGSTCTYHRSPRGDHPLVTAPEPVRVAQVAPASASEEAEAPSTFPMPESPMAGEWAGPPRFTRPRSPPARQSACAARPGWALSALPHGGR